LVGSILSLALQQGTSGTVEITIRDASTREGIVGVPVTLTYKLPTEPL
jgi:hypothetical protein